MTTDRPTLGCGRGKRVGVVVRCVVCGRMKQPIGRAAPLAASYCHAADCSGYWHMPYAGSLWPGETDEAFGYPVGTDGTEAYEARCNWREDDEGNWHTDCGNIFVLIEGTPAQNGLRFCGYCGQLLCEQPARAEWYDDSEEGRDGE